MGGRGVLAGRGGWLDAVEKCGGKKHEKKLAFFGEI